MKYADYLPLRDMLNMIQNQTINAMSRSRQEGDERMTSFCEGQLSTVHIVTKYIENSLIQIEEEKPCT